MSTYATAEDIARFIDRLTAHVRPGAGPAFVNDLDGNLLVGYSLAQGQRLLLGPHDNPANQAIPYGSTPAQIRAWVEQGALVEGIFAAKAMDARLPTELVERVNAQVRARRLFDIAFLTSRSTTDALTLLRESGIEQPEELTLIADSGATFSLRGARRAVRPLSDIEQEFLNQIDTAAARVAERIHAILTALGFDAARCPQLYIEPKGVAKNIHYREVLRAYGQAEGSELDQQIGAAVAAEMRRLVAAGPRQADGSLAFKALDGPATLEVIVADLNKGHGLHAITAAAMQHTPAPTAIIFTGDDVSKGNGAPGTDYFAMIEAENITSQFGVPVYTIHTQHPQGGQMDGGQPDEHKSALALSEQYPPPRIDLRVPTPRALAALIIAANDAARQKEMRL